MKEIGAGGNYLLDILNRLTICNQIKEVISCSTQMELRLFEMLTINLTVSLL